MTPKVYKNFFVLILFIITLIPNSKMTSHPLSDDFADLVEKLSPSVVNVFTVQKPKQTNNQVPFDNIPPQFRDFFKNFPVRVFSSASFSGGPLQTNSPPFAPPPGPSSRIWSAIFKTSRLCSMTKTVLPCSTSRFRQFNSSLMSWK